MRLRQSATRLWLVPTLLVFLAGSPRVLGAVRPDGPESRQIRAALAQVDSLLSVGDLAQAASVAGALHARHADDPFLGWQVEARLGVVLLRGGDPAAALPPLENAVRKNTSQPASHRNLGAALVQLGRRGRALAEYAQAVELAPNDPEIRLEYGQLLLDFRDVDRARDQILAADRLCGGCPAAQEPLVRLHLAAGEFDQAAAILQPLLAQRPSAGLRRTFIQALQGAGRDSTLLEFLGRDPVAGLPQDEAMLLVELEGKLGRPVHSEAFALALGDPAREAALVPAAVLDRDRFWGLVSYNLLLAGRDRAALTAAGRAVSLAPDNAVYRNNRVVLLTRLGRHEEAAREWAKARALDPTLKESTEK